MKDSSRQSGRHVIRVATGYAPPPFGQWRVVAAIVGWLVILSLPIWAASWVAFPAIVLWLALCPLFLRASESLVIAGGMCVLAGIAASMPGRRLDVLLPLDVLLVLGVAWLHVAWALFDMWRCRTGVRDYATRTLSRLVSSLQEPPQPAFEGALVSDLSLEAGFRLSRRGRILHVTFEPPSTSFAVVSATGDRIEVRGTPVLCDLLLQPEAATVVHAGGRSVLELPAQTRVALQAEVRWEAAMEGGYRAEPTRRGAVTGQALLRPLGRGGALQLHEAKLSKRMAKLGLVSAVGVIGLALVVGIVSRSLPVPWGVSLQEMDLEELDQVQGSPDAGVGCRDRSRCAVFYVGGRVLARADEGTHLVVEGTTVANDGQLHEVDVDLESLFRADSFHGAMRPEYASLDIHASNGFTSDRASLWLGYAAWGPAVVELFLPAVQTGLPVSLPGDDPAPPARPRGIVVFYEAGDEVRLEAELSEPRGLNGLDLVARVHESARKLDDCTRGLRQISRAAVDLSIRVVDRHRGRVLLDVVDRAEVPDCANLPARTPRQVTYRAKTSAAELLARARRVD